LYAATDLGIQVFDPTGRLCGVLLKPKDEPLIGVAFGGSDNDRLFTVCGDKLYSRKLKTRGVPPPTPPRP
jgi:enterochelin esterase family protein